jgi:hypothetical protein
VPKIAIFNASVQFLVNITRSGEAPPKKSHKALRHAYTLCAQEIESLCPLLPAFAQFFSEEYTPATTPSGLKPPVAALSK